MNVLPLLATTATEAEIAPYVIAGVLLSLVAIYVASKVGSEASFSLGFPPVLGELLAGVVVGVSALHLVVFPSETVAADSSLIMRFLQWSDAVPAELLPQVFESVSEVLSVAAELGVIVLLFEIGLESNLSELLQVGLQAVVVAAVGVVVPFAGGALGAVYLFDVDLITAIFVGAALTATSIGITSKVLSELGQLTSQEGQIILGAAVVDDVIGIVILAVVASLSKTGQVDPVGVLSLVASAVGFTVGAIAAGTVINRLFLGVSNWLKTRGGLIVPAFVLSFILAYIGIIARLEAILGSFAAGLLLDETDQKEDLEAQVKPVADLLVPIFFVVVGARTDVGVLNPFVPENREGLVIASFLLLVAILGKLATGLAIFGPVKINRLAVGIGMIPRGEVGLVFAAVGSATGVLTPALNAAVIVMVIVTTFLAPPLLRFCFPPETTPEIAVKS
ncbi:MAG: cation:proton antiporter [Oscillatoriales cyanobacterium SM2_2_1]|nr:cation:proton antiporter [Oscillatoriales cyanobacterium SM2_2_1]